MAAQRRWLQLRLHLGGEMGTGELGPGLLVVFEGSDAAGKGGAIKRVVEPLDPRHYRVTSFAKPTFDEKRHAFLWRFYPYVPGLGGMSVFDRSWYGRVLVERIEGFATDDEWSRAYEEIVGFERMTATGGGDPRQVLAADQPRGAAAAVRGPRERPLRKWKITDEDWRNRKKADQYSIAAEEMFERTDHHLAPWDVVSGEQKRYARIKVLETLIGASSWASSAGAGRSRTRSPCPSDRPGWRRRPAEQLTATMRAAILHEYGPPENLVVEEVPDLTPKPHQLVVDVHACGVNFPDVLMVQDLYQFKPALPFSPGGEISGRCRRSGPMSPAGPWATSSPPASAPAVRRAGRRRRVEGLPHPRGRRPDRGRRLPDDVRHLVPRPQGPGEPAAR